MAAGADSGQPEVDDFDELLRIGVAERLLVDTVEVRQQPGVKPGRRQGQEMLLPHVSQVDARRQRSLRWINAVFF